MSKGIFFGKKAVALHYPPGAPAPFIVAKARGRAAEHILAIADEMHIPVLKDINMANVLTMYEIGDYIPEETYSAIAAIFVYIYNMTGCSKT